MKKIKKSDFEKVLSNIIYFDNYKNQLISLVQLRGSMPRTLTLYVEDCKIQSIDGYMNLDDLIELNKIIYDLLKEENQHD